MTDLTFTKSSFNKWTSKFQLTKSTAQIHLDFADGSVHKVELGQTLTGTNPITFDQTNAFVGYDKVVSGCVVGSFITITTDAQPTLAKYLE